MCTPMLGPLQLGQPREVVVDMERIPSADTGREYLEAVLTYPDPCSRNLSMRVGQISAHFRVNKS